MKLVAGWKASTVPDVCSYVTVGIVVQPAALYTRNGSGVRCFRSLNVGEGRVNDKDWVFISPESHRMHNKSALQVGDVVVVRTGDAGKACVISSDFAESNCIDLIILRPNGKKIRPDFLCSLINSDVVRSHVHRGVGGLAQKHFNIGEVKRVKIPLPPLAEQEEIVSVIELQQHCVEKIKALVSANRELKRGLMQHLLTGQTRFKEFVKSLKKTKTRYGDFPEDWSQVHMGEIADEAGKKNGDGRELPVLSCTKHRGLVNSLEYFGKRIFSEDTSAYRVVKRGDFAYATNHIEEGSIGYQNLHEAALISPMYTVFRTKPGVDHEFFWKLIKTELYRHMFEANTSGSIARRGALRWDEFALIKVFLPSVPEQKRIAAVLNTCEEEIRLLEKQLAALTEQKRGLMQKLLTGEVRVKV